MSQPPLPLTYALLSCLDEYEALVGAFECSLLAELLFRHQPVFNRYFLAQKEQSRVGDAYRAIMNK